MSVRIHEIEPPLTKNEFESRYGVSLERANPLELARVIDTLYTQLIALSGLSRRLEIAPFDDVIAYAPTYVLAKAPTPEQVTAYNADFTKEVSAYTVGVQEELEKVPIVESGERFVYLPDHIGRYSQLNAGFSNTTFHTACGEWAGKPRQFWARESFANRLVLMNTLLQSQSLRLYFEDAFRPVGVQEGLFKRRVDWTRADHPNWSFDDIIQEAKSKTAVKPRLASHKGGAAVDARLQNMKTGEILDFGHNYPDGGALVFPQTTFITKEQWLNRQRFQIAAALSGLTLYVGEDWHVSFGDNLASLDGNGRVRPNYVAQYGPVKEFDETTGDIIRYYSSDEMDQVFDL